MSVGVENVLVFGTVDVTVPLSVAVGVVFEPFLVVIVLAIVVSGSEIVVGVETEDKVGHVLSPDVAALPV